MTGERKGTGDILSTLTIAVLFLVILLLVVFSASSYKQATDIQNGNNNRRALLSYVTSCVRENSGSDMHKHKTSENITEFSSVWKNFFALGKV